MDMLDMCSFAFAGALATATKTKPADHPEASTTRCLAYDGTDASAI